MLSMRCQLFQQLRKMPPSSAARLLARLAFAPISLALLSGIYTPVAAFAAPAATTTSLSLTSSGNAVGTVASGTVVTLTASVAAGGSALTKGQVNFCDASGPHCTDVHLLATRQLTKNGTAVFKFIPGTGSHTYKAVFLPTTTYATSASGVTALTVTGALSTTTSISSSGGSGNYSLTATVVGSGSLSAPTGTVSFLDTSNSNYSLGSATLGSGAKALNFVGTASQAEPYSLAAIAVGDFNADGIPDMAVAAYASGSVLVFLGKGDGTFTQMPDTPSAGSTPSSINIADFNGDGIPDLILANLWGSSATVLLGNGDGTFTTTSTLPAGSFSRAVAVGDFNRDGVEDVAIVNTGSASVTVLLGNGDGTFTPTSQSPATGSDPNFIAAADLNGDGNIDLVTANEFGNSLTVLLGNGDGTFTPSSQSPSTGSNPASVVIADFNGDGIPDLATANNGDNTVTVLLGNGDGTFTPSSQSPSTGDQPSSITVADFNGDAIPDLVVGNYDDYDSYAVSVLLGNGDGTFTTTQATLPGENNPNFVAVGDFNGDGIPDMAIPGDYGRMGLLIGQLTQTATATVTGISPAGTGTHAVEAGYPGDKTYASSLSSSIGLTAATVSTTLTLSASSSSSVYEQQVTLTATLSPWSAQGHTTNGESITFYNGTTNLGTGTLSAGSATLQITSLPVGTDQITATYNGDTAFQGSSSSAYPITVAADTSFTITPNPSSETVRRGASLAGFILRLQSVNGFKGKVKLSCSGSIDSVCVDLPQTVNLNGTALALTGILFPKTTAPGTYTITFTGVSGTLTGTATAEFKVTQ